MSRRTMSESTDLSQIVRNNPKFVGVLFALMVLLSQAGTVAAGGAYTVVAGP